MVNPIIANEQNIVLAAAQLKLGELVVFPTDTVYGIGADAFDGAAIEALFIAKERPLDKGIPVLLADTSDLSRVSTAVSPFAQNLIHQFWPGPLTLIVPKHPALPAIISPNDGIAVRIPDNAIARQLIRQAGGALATSSANKSSYEPAQTAVQAQTQLGNDVTVILDGGATRGNVASTIIDCRTATPKIIRQGPISAEQLLENPVRETL